METLKAGDKRLISYAVDLGTRITEAFGSKAAVVREIHANRGILTTKIRRRGDAHLHRAQRGSEGQDADHRAPAAAPATRCSTRSRRRRPPRAYRFEIPLAAGASQEFAVTEERVYDQKLRGDQPHPRCAAELYVRNRSLSDAGRRAVAAHRRPESADRRERPRPRAGARRRCAT